MKQIIELTPAFDKRHSDPSKNYGIHGVDLRMILQGKLGAVQFVLYTNWQLPHVTAEQNNRKGHLFCQPLPADLGYHAPTPQHEGQPSQPNCPYLDGQPCYYDGSGLQAEAVYQTLLTEGSEGVWNVLKQKYKSLFGKLQ